MSGSIDASRYLIPTLKDDPADAEAISHKLLVRGGFVRQVGAGLYTYLPLGWKVLQNAMGIIREEMDTIGLEMLMPVLQPAELWERTGLTSDRTVLGGFSMGAVMSYAMGLGADRPAPAGILAFSGFVPTVAGWEPSLADRTGTRAFVSHGSRDPVIGVEFAERARELLEAGGIDVTYRTSELGHQIDPAHLRDAATWLGDVLG